MQYLTTANILGWLFFALGLQMTFIAHWLASMALAPQKVAKAAEHYNKPVRVVLLGLLPLVGLITLGIVIMNVAPPAIKWIGGLIVSVPIVLGLAGSAGLALKIGQGLPAPTDDAQPWRRVLRGGIVMALAMLLPLIGQLFFIPLVLASGLGAWTLNFFPPKRPKAAEVTEPSSLDEAQTA